MLIADIDTKTAQETVEEIRRTGQRQNRHRDLVPRDRGERRRYRVGATRRVDILVNNAGIMDDMAATADVSDKSWERLLRINLTAPFMLTRAVLPYMKKQGTGSIVFTASEASLRGSASGTAYTVSKHGIVGLVKSTAIMYRDQGIRVNAVTPGGTSTNISVEQPTAPDGPTVLGSYAHNRGRVARSEELAAAIVFLASEAASNINGAILPVDNGWSAV